jgi:putative tryptophan/tyrosine transport system substrate-binding protein
VAQFRRGLAEAGFIERQTALIEYRWANNQGQRPALLAELVQRQVAVIVALAGPSIVAAKSATSTIPIVLVTTSDQRRTRCPDMEET